MTGWGLGLKGRTWEAGIGNRNCRVRKCRNAREQIKEKEIVLHTKMQIQKKEGGTKTGHWNEMLNTEYWTLNGNEAKTRRERNWWRDGMNGVKELTSRNNHEMTKCRQAGREMWRWIWIHAEMHEDRRQKERDSDGSKQWCVGVTIYLCSRIAVAFGSIVSRSHNSSFSSLPSPCLCL